MQSRLRLTRQTVAVEQSRRTGGGFTLLEVLVALAVLAIAMGALIKVASQNAGTAAYLRDKTLAHWVAMNRVVRYEISGAWPSIGDASGTSEMGDRRWYWRAHVSGTPDRDMRRLHVEVASNDRRNAPLASLDTLLPRP